MLLLTCLVALLPTVDNPDLELTSALARRGWLDLADELCVRIEKLPGATIVLAEVASARARQEPDPAAALRELDAAIARLGSTLSPDERGMAGALHVQKARLTNEPRAWEAAEAFYKASVAELQKAPQTEEALLDARLELAKATASRAKSISGDEDLRKKLLAEAVRLFVDFQFDTGTRPIAFEAVLEEGRARAELRDFPRAERCFRAVLGLKQKGIPGSEYLNAVHDAAFLDLLKLLSSAGKGREAVAAADLFLRGPRSTSGYGIAVRLARAEAMHAAGARAEALAAAQGIVALDPDGLGGAVARNLIREWTKDGGATAAQLLLVADGLIDRGLHKDALIQLRRAVEVCRDAAERSAVEPAAAFKRGDCFRTLKREMEASLAYQEVFRKHPKHELAQRAAFEAVRALIRSAASTRDRRDEDLQEALLKEIRARGLQGSFAGFFSFLEAEILERKGQWKAAADVYRTVDEGCEVYADALVSAAHCLRRDVDAKGDPKGLQAAEQLLRRAAARLEKGANPRLLATAQVELATILIQTRPKEALEFIERCAKQLPEESEMLPRLGEMEIRARLGMDDVAGAAARLDRLTGPAATRSARRVAYRLEATDPARAAHYYRVWLDATETEDATPVEVRAVADGAYRMARAVSRVDDKVFSVLDLRGKPVSDHAVWKDAARAQLRLVSLKGLSGEERNAAETRLVFCGAMAAESADDWGRVKKHAEDLVAGNGLVGAQGINAAVLQKQAWLAGIYLEYGHALYQLGKAGQKFQYANALTVFGHFVDVAQNGSEPWWVCKAMGLRILFERGDEADLRRADAGISNLERNHPDFDAGKYGMKPVLVELREQIKASVGLRR